MASVYVTRVLNLRLLDKAASQVWVSLSRSCVRQIMSASPQQGKIAAPVRNGPGSPSGASSPSKTSFISRLFGGGNNSADDSSQRPALEISAPLSVRHEI